MLKTRQVKREMDFFDKFIGIDGLLQEADRTVFHGFDSHADGSVTRQDDDPDGTSGFSKFGLHVAAAHALHGHVDNETAGLCRVDRTEEFFARRKCLGVETVRGERKPDGITDVVIIHHPDRQVGGNFWSCFSECHKKARECLQLYDAFRRQRTVVGRCLRTAIR